MFYVILGMGLLFFGLGFLVTENNASSLLSGYNTMSKEEQEKFPLTEYLERFKGFHIRFGILFTVLGVPRHAHLPLRQQRRRGGLPCGRHKADSAAGEPGGLRASH